jgi:abequosyltransferase
VPLLSIAIPTFNRSGYLDLCLSELIPQLEPHGDDVELITCDNASADETPEVIARHAVRYSRLRSVRHPNNIGSDSNIARCFTLARGKHVLILGDDDVLVPGAVARVVDTLRNADPGVLFLRPYGYDVDFLRERPPTRFMRPRSFTDSQRFIRETHVYGTFISSNVLNKALLGGIDPERYVGTNLVQLYLFLHAALRATTNICLPEYLVAAKRNNSGGYDYVRVFVGNMATALDSLGGQLEPRTRRAINDSMVFRHLPYYVFRMRLEAVFDRTGIRSVLRRAYGTRLRYWVCLEPLLHLPIPLARAWVWALILASRMVAGEFARVAAFAITRIFPRAGAKARAASR